jgi:hypothetical protein
VRFVGFDSKQQKKMSDMLTKKRAIEIKIVRSNTLGEVTKWIAKIWYKKTDVPDIDFKHNTQKDIALDALQSKYAYELSMLRFISRVTRKRFAKVRSFRWQTLVKLGK